MENKEAFVKEFGDLLRKYGVEDVAYLKYERKGDVEVVIITFHGGHQMAVNVSMDSYAAIVRDVMRALY